MPGGKLICSLQVDSESELSLCGLHMGNIGKQEGSPSPQGHSLGSGGRDSITQLGSQAPPPGQGTPLCTTPSPGSLHAHPILLALGRTQSAMTPSTHPQAWCGTCNPTHCADQETGMRAFPLPIHRTSSCDFSVYLGQGLEGWVIELGSRIPGAFSQKLLWINDQHLTHSSRRGSDVSPFIIGFGSL